MLAMGTGEPSAGLRGVEALQFDLPAEFLEVLDSSFCWAVMAGEPLRRGPRRRVASGSRTPDGR